MDSGYEARQLMDAAPQRQACHRHIIRYCSRKRLARTLSALSVPHFKSSDTSRTSSGLKAALVTKGMVAPSSAPASASPFWRSSVKCVARAAICSQTRLAVNATSAPSSRPNRNSAPSSSKDTGVTVPDAASHL